MNALENLDLSALETPEDVTEKPKAAPKQAPKKAVKKDTKVSATVVDREDVETVTVTFDDIQAENFPLAKLVERVANGEIELSVERKAWNGVRSRRESQRVAGVRKQLRDIGFLMDEDSQVVDPNGNGRLASANYTNGTASVRVHYAIEPNYGHRIRKS